MGNKLSTVVNVNGKFYWVDTCYTLDHGYETMAFPSNKNGEVTSWLEVYANRYFTWAEAEAGHKLATDPNFLKENLWE